jgi:hypothetical protein
LVSFKGVKEFGPVVDPLLTVDAGVVGVAGEDPRVAMVDREVVDPLCRGWTALEEYPPRPKPNPMLVP